MAFIVVFCSISVLVFYLGAVSVVNLYDKKNTHTRKTAQIHWFYFILSVFRSPQFRFLAQNLRISLIVAVIAIIYGIWGYSFKFTFIDLSC